MNTTWNKKENSQGELLVTINGEKWNSAKEKAFKKCAEKIEIPGFRKGKAPLSAVNKHLKRQTVLLEACDSSLEEAYRVGLEEQQVRPIMQPNVDIKSLTEDECVVSFTITVAPEVKLPADYKSYKIDVEEVSVSDEDIEKEVSKLQEDYSLWVLKEDGAVEVGNQVVMDFKGYDGDTAFEGGSGENFELVIGSKQFIPGFEEQLVDMKSGEKKTIDVSFPENYPAKDLAGKPVKFDVTVHEIRVKQLPEVNDEFVKELNEENVDTVEQLRDSIKNKIMASRQLNAETEAENKLIEKVVENSEVDVPQVMVDSEVDQMIEEFKHRLQSQGMNFEMFKQFSQTTDDAFRKQMEPEALKRVKMRLMLTTIAKEEKIEVSDEDIEKEYQTISETYNLPIEKVKELAGVNEIRFDTKIKKAYDLLVSQNKK